MHAEARQSIVLTLGTGTAAALGMAYLVYAARALGPVEFGEFATSVSIVVMCRIALGPIHATVTRFTAEYAGRDDYGKIQALSRMISGRVGLAGLVVALVTLAMAKPLSHLLQFRSAQPLMVAVGIAYVTMLVGISRGVLRGVSGFVPFNVGILVESSSRLALGIVLLALAPTSAAGLLAYLFAIVMALAVSKLQLRTLLRGHPQGQIEDHSVWRFAAPMFVFLIISAGFQHGDMLVVKYLFSPQEAGQYGAAFSLSRTIEVLATPIYIMALPLLTGMHQQGSSPGGTLRRLFMYFLILAAVPVSLCWIWPNEILVTVYGNAYAGAGTVLAGLAAVRLVGHLCHLVGLASAATDRFAFLIPYSVGFGVQTIALIIWHGSLGQVVVVMLVCQGTVFTVVAVQFLLHHRQRLVPAPSSSS